MQRTLGANLYSLEKKPTWILVGKPIISVISGTSVFATRIWMTIILH